MVKDQTDYTPTKTEEEERQSQTKVETESKINTQGQLDRKVEIDRQDREGQRDRPCQPSPSRLPTSSLTASSVMQIDIDTQTATSGNLTPRQHTHREYQDNSRCRRTLMNSLVTVKRSISAEASKRRAEMENRPSCVFTAGFASWVRRGVQEAHEDRKWMKLCDCCGNSTVVSVWRPNGARN